MGKNKINYLYMVYGFLMHSLSKNVPISRSKSLMARPAERLMTRLLMTILCPLNAIFILLKQKLERPQILCFVVAQHNLRGATMSFSQIRPGVSNRIPFEGEGFTFIGNVVLPVLLMVAPLNLSMTTLLLHTFAHFTGTSGILYAQGQ